MGLFRRSSSTQDVVTEADTIDLTDSEKHHGAQAGVPGRCPECDGFGYIDNIDMVHRYQRQHCRDCGHSWEFSFDEEGEVVGEVDLTGSPSKERTDDPWSIGA